MSSSSSTSSQGLMAAYNNGYYTLDHLQHHTIPVFHADMLSTSLMDDWGCGSGDGGGMVNTPPMMVSPNHHHYTEDISTGYLEDALVEFTNSRPKRRRLQLVYNDEPTSSSYYNRPDKQMGYWNNSNRMSLGEFTGDLNCMMMMMDQDNFNDRVSDQYMTNSLPDEAKRMSSCNSSYEMKASLEATSGSAMEEPLSSSCSDKSIPSPSLVPASLGDKESRNQVGNKKATSNKRIVYPFALVKPGGVEGDMTINDINERILMPPARPVRHPVGDFACRPRMSTDGPGLSGKAVVALTKIQTQGRGTITIIRTRG